jgi:low affinity Fe/Cu permease
MRDAFHRLARRAADLMGRPGTFIAALLVIILWAVSGPAFGYSDTWQLVINTGTTIITFLMVFLIQHTQNRDAQAVHLKLDELIRSVGAARTRLVHLEDLSEDELKGLEREFQRLHERLKGDTEPESGERE